MDEIGFLEEDSPEFQQAVVSSLRRAKHCLCVLRKGNFSFIDTLEGFDGCREHRNPENREEVYSRIVREIEKRGLIYLSWRRRRDLNP